MNTCQFCKSSFSNSQNLLAHQRSAKYCLEKQGIPAPPSPVCEFCNQSFSTPTRLRTHKETCINKVRVEEKRADETILQHTVNMYELKLQMMEEKLKAKDEENTLLKEQLALRIDEKDTQICLLREQLERRIDDITDIARQTKTKTNHTNIQINNAAPLDLNDISHIHSILQEHMDINVLAAGQKGVARMLKEHYLTDENGLKRYRCTDANRGNFEYTDPNGHVERDPKCAKLREALVKSNIHDIAYERGDGWWKKEDGSTDMTKFEVMSGPVQEVALIANDDTKLRTELSVIMS